MLTKEYFKDEELSCNCGCGLMPDQDSVEKLYALRILYGKPIKINSGARCQAYNRTIGGKEYSTHMKGAFDCDFPPEDEVRFIKLAIEVGFTGIGFYNNRFVHLDAHHINPTMW